MKKRRVSLQSAIRIGGGYIRHPDDAESRMVATEAHTSPDALCFPLTGIDRH